VSVEWLIICYLKVIRFEKNSSLTLFWTLNISAGKVQTWLFKNIGMLMTARHVDFIGEIHFLCSDKVSS